MLYFSNIISKHIAITLRHWKTNKRKNVQIHTCPFIVQFVDEHIKCAKEDLQLRKFGKLFDKWCLNNKMWKIISAFTWKTLDLRRDNKERINFNKESETCQLENQFWKLKVICLYETKNWNSRRNLKILF